MVTSIGSAKRKRKIYVDFFYFSVYGVLMAWFTSMAFELDKLVDRIII